MTEYKCSGINRECKGCIVTVPEMEEDCGRPDSCIWTRYTKNIQRVLWVEQSSPNTPQIVIPPHCPVHKKPMLHTPTRPDGNWLCTDCVVMEKGSQGSEDELCQCGFVGDFTEDGWCVLCGKKRGTESSDNKDEIKKCSGHNVEQIKKFFIEHPIHTFSPFKIANHLDLEITQVISVLKALENEGVLICTGWKLKNLDLIKVKLNTDVTKNKEGNQNEDKTV